MVSKIRIYSSFSKDDWHPEPVQGLVLCLAFIAIGCRLFRGCDANMEVIGQLHKFHSANITIKCWFPVGTFKAYSLKLSRLLSRTGSYLYRTNKEALLCKAPASPHNSSAKNLLKGESKVSGNLSHGITFILFNAKCDDAGEYKCSYQYETVNFNNKLVEVDNYVETKRLHVISNPFCFMSQRWVDFDNIRPGKRVAVRMNCQAFSTAGQFRWLWESALPASKSSDMTWTRVEDELVQTRTLPEKCGQRSYSSLLYLINASDKNRHFRVCTFYSEYDRQCHGGQTSITIKDRPKGFYQRLPTTPSTPHLIRYKDVLISAGWAVCVVLMLILTFFILSHLLYPRMPWLQTFIQNHRTLRAVRDWLVDFNLMDDLTLGQGHSPPGGAGEQIQQVMTLPSQEADRRASAGGQTTSSVAVDTDVDLGPESLSLEGVDIVGAEESLSARCPFTQYGLDGEVDSCQEVEGAVPSDSPAHLPLQSQAVCSRSMDSAPGRLSPKPRAKPGKNKDSTSGQLSPKSRAEPACSTGSPSGQLSPKLASSTAAPSGQLSPKLASSTAAPSGQLSPKLASSTGSPSGQLSPKLASSTAAPSGQLSPKLASSTAAPSGQLSPKLASSTAAPLEQLSPKLASSTAAPSGELSPKLASSTGSPSGQLSPKPASSTAAPLQQLSLANSRGSSLGGNGVSSSSPGPSHADEAFSPPTTADSSVSQTHRIPEMVLPEPLQRSGSTENTRASGPSPTSPRGRRSQRSDDRCVQGGARINKDL